MIEIGTIADIKAANSSLPFAQGFPVYYQAARAYIVLIDTVAPGVRARARTRPATAPRSTCARCTSAARTSAASRTRASRTTGWSARATARAMTASGSRPRARSTARRRAAWTASRSRSTPTASSIVDTSKITLGPLPGRGRPARHHPAEEPRRLHMTDRDRRPARRAGRSGALPARRPPERARPEPRSAERFTAPRQTRAIGGPDLGARREDRPPVRRRALGRVPRASSIVALFVIVYYFYELGVPIINTHAAAGGRRTSSSRSPPSSAATTCTRPTARAATASTARAASGRS